MADEKISAMPAASAPFTGAEKIPLVQAGGNPSTTSDQLAQQLFLAGGRGANVTTLTLNNNAAVQNFSLSWDGSNWNFAGTGFVFVNPVSMETGLTVAGDVQATGNFVGLSFGDAANPGVFFVDSNHIFYDSNGIQILAMQQSAVANATNAVDVITQLNALLARLRTHGLIAT